MNAPGTVQPNDDAHRPGTVAVLNDAMLSFTAWDRPWRFHGEVERRLAGTAASTVHATEQDLCARYPWLQPAAVTAVVRAASYAWR